MGRTPTKELAGLKNGKPRSTELSRAMGLVEVEVSSPNFSVIDLAKQLVSEFVSLGADSSSEIVPRS